MSLWNGRTVHVEVSNSFLTLPGQPTLLLSVFRDVTERKRAEDALRESVSLLEATLESTADGILVADAQGRMVRFNQKFVQMWRLPKSIVDSGSDDAALEFVLSQLKEPQQFLDKVRWLYSQAEESSFDTIDFKDGRTFERYSQPQRIGARVVGRVWSFRDVTQRREAEAALLRSETELAAIHDNAPVMLGLFDAPARVVRANRALADFAGKPPRELVGLGLCELIGCTRGLRKPTGPDFGAECAECAICLAFKAAIETGTPVRRLEVQPPAGWSTCGSDAALLMSSVRVELDRGCHVLLCLEDISHQKRLEARLRQAQKMEAVGRLVGGVAHDFNNILTVVLGNASLLAGVTSLASEDLELVRQIAEAAERAANLTRQLLAFSRQQVLQMRRLDLNVVLANIWWRIWFSPKGLTAMRWLST